MASATRATGATGVRAPEMRLSIEEVAKKMSLWHNSTFRPILTHDDLEPIMTAAGFAPLPPPPAVAAPGAVVWREYEYCCGARRGPPRPRLPYPRLDGLHLMTYQAFFATLVLHLGALRVSNLFHVRAMRLNKEYDRVFNQSYRQMQEFGEDSSILVYRDGTVDHITRMIWSTYNSIWDGVGDYMIAGGGACGDLTCSKKMYGNEEDGSASINLVAVKELFPDSDILSG